MSGNPAVESVLLDAPLSAENVLTCPNCGAPTDVKGSRPTLNYGFTSTRRRRHCTSCEHRFTTIEINVNSYERLTGIPARLNVVRASLNALLDHINRIKGDAP